MAASLAHSAARAESAGLSGAAEEQDAAVSQTASPDPVALSYRATRAAGDVRLHPLREPLLLQHHRLGRSHAESLHRRPLQLSADLCQPCVLRRLQGVAVLYRRSSDPDRLALYFATILSFKVKFKNLWKGIIFFPYLINGVADRLHLQLLLRAWRHPRLGRSRSSAITTSTRPTGRSWRTICGWATLIWSTSRWRASLCGATWG